MEHECLVDDLASATRLSYLSCSPNKLRAPRITFPVGSLVQDLLAFRGGHCPRHSLESPRAFKVSNALLLLLLPTPPPSWSVSCKT